MDMNPLARAIRAKKPESNKMGMQLMMLTDADDAESIALKEATKATAPLGCIFLNVDHRTQKPAITPVTVCNSRSTLNG
jgi:hypothetical protein